MDVLTLSRSCWMPGDWLDMDYIFEFPTLIWSSAQFILCSGLSWTFVLIFSLFLQEYSESVSWPQRGRTGIGHFSGWNEPCFLRRWLHVGCLSQIFQMLPDYCLFGKLTALKSFSIHGDFNSQATHRCQCRVRLWELPGPRGSPQEDANNEEVFIPNETLPLHTTIGLRNWEVSITRISCLLDILKFCNAAGCDLPREKCFQVIPWPLGHWYVGSFCNSFPVPGGLGLVRVLAICWMMAVTYSWNAYTQVDWSLLEQQPICHRRCPGWYLGSQSVGIFWTSWSILCELLALIDAYYPALLYISCNLVC